MGALRNWKGVACIPIMQSPIAQDFFTISKEKYTDICFLTHMAGRSGTRSDNFGMSWVYKGVIQNPVAVVERMEKEGLLVITPFAEIDQLCIDMMDAGNDKINQICNENNIRVIKDKRKLMQRLVDAGLAQQIPKSEKWYTITLTEKGCGYAKALFEERFACERRTFLYLKTGAVEKAISERCAYEDKQPVQDGINCDWGELAKKPKRFSQWQLLQNCTVDHSDQFCFEMQKVLWGNVQLELDEL